MLSEVTEGEIQSLPRPLSRARSLQLLLRSQIEGPRRTPLLLRKQHRAPCAMQPYEILVFLSNNSSSALRPLNPTHGLRRDQGSSQYKGAVK